MSYAKRFIGAESLPARLTEFEVRQFFPLGKDDVEAIAARFRLDRQPGVALQLVFLRASGRPLDRFAVVPRALLRSVCAALGTPGVTIASLRSIYQRRPTLYEHQQWVRAYLGLHDLDDRHVEDVRAVLAVAAREAAHADDLETVARDWLHQHRILIPGPRRITEWARDAFAASEDAMAAAIEAELGAAELAKVVEWAYSRRPAQAASHIEWLKTPPARHSPSTIRETLEKVQALKCQRRFKSDPLCRVAVEVNLTHLGTLVRAPRPRRAISPERARGARRRSFHRRSPPDGLAGLTLVLEPVALAGDLHDVGVVQETVEHGRRQRLVVGEGTRPLGERQVARQHHRAALVALGHDVEEEVGLLAPEGQVADLVDHQQLGSQHRTGEVLLEPALGLGRGQLQHQVGRGEEAHLVAGHDRPMGEGQRDVRLAHTARSSHILPANSS